MAMMYRRTSGLTRPEMKSGCCKEAELNSDEIMHIMMVGCLLFDAFSYFEPVKSVRLELGALTTACYVSNLNSLYLVTILPKNS